MSGCYQELKVWKKSMELTLVVYRTTQKFPDREIYSLTNQMRRAAVSIPSNIAEGKGKSSVANSQCSYATPAARSMNWRRKL
jgi:four helix bundle protein